MRVELAVWHEHPGIAHPEQGKVEARPRAMLFGL